MKIDFDLVLNGLLRVIIQPIETGRIIPPKAIGMLEINITALL